MDSLLNEARIALRPDSMLIAGQAAAEPPGLLSRLAQEIGSGRQMTGASTTVFRGMSLIPPHVIPDNFRILSFGALGSNRYFLRRGRLSVVPEGVGTVPEYFRSGKLAGDVLLLRAAPLPDGDFSVGLVSDYVPAALESTPNVLLEIDDAIPVLPGATVVPRDRVNGTIGATSGIPTLERPRIRDEDRELASNVVSLIRNGDCLQFGIGSLARSIAARCAQTKKNLGLHTGLITRDVLDLIDSGAITNEYKEIDRGLSVAPLVMGETSMYRRIGARTDIMLRPVDYANRPAVFTELRNFVAINSAIEVDLLGQINAEIVDGQRIGTVGGQFEFFHGAGISEGGRAISVSRSTAKDGTISSIVPRLSAATVTVPAGHVDYVVTEYGIASLRGETLERRARNLIAIAHPKFRRSLSEAWDDGQSSFTGATFE